MKKKKSDLKIKNLKNLTFQVFRFLKKPKKPRFFKMGLDSPGYDERYKIIATSIS